MTKDEELLNEIIQRRGYWVVQADQPCHAGQQLNFYHSDDLLNTGAPMYIIGPTDAADMNEQNELISRLILGLATNVGRRWERFETPYFYRVLSD